jgi:signal peptidase
MTAEPLAADAAITAQRARSGRGHHKRRPSKTARRPRATVGSALLGLLVVFVAVVAVGVLSGNWQIRPVLSGSMRPGLPVGGVAVSQSVPLSDIKVRDVIVFHKPTDPAELVVHRVIQLQHTGSTYIAKTQGDANDVADPWTVALNGDTAYRVRFSLPLLGYPGVWLRNAGRMNLLAVGGGMVILFALVSMWRKDRGDPAEPKPGPAGDSQGNDVQTASTEM